MNLDFAGLIALTLLGAAAGIPLAHASLSLPGVAARPSPRRYAACAAACALGALWAGVAAVGLLAPVGAALAIPLILIGLIDAEHFWLPHKLTVPLGLLGFAEAAVLEPDQTLSRLIGAGVGFCALAGIAWLYRRVRGREGLGGGDFRLLAAAGAWVGWEGLPSVLVIACLCGLGVAGAQAIRRRRLDFGLEVPFGVYLSAGLWLTWLYGPMGFG